MNQTTNYNLNQWDAADPVRREDFNSDNAIIDAALKAAADARAAVDKRADGLEAVLAEHTAQIAKLGNCQVYTTTYVGNGQCGEEHPSTLTFPQKPLLAFVSRNGYNILRIFPFNTSYSYRESSLIYVEITWSGNTVIWNASTPDGQMNSNGTTYYVTAFYAMD